MYLYVHIWQIYSKMPITCLMYVCMHIYIYMERERDKEVALSFGTYSPNNTSEKIYHWALKSCIFFNMFIIKKHTKFIFDFYWLNDTIWLLKISQSVELFTVLH